MAIKTKNSAPAAAPSYVDFDPSCDLQTEDGLQTLIINLPDFKKNQIKVQVNKDGVLRVSGERPTNADGTKRCRFTKDTKLAENCDVNGIRAKFTEGHLHVMIPKKVTPTPTLTPTPAPTPTSAQAIQDPHPASAPPKPEVMTENQKPKSEAAAMKSDEHKTKDTKKSSDENDQGKSYDHMFEHGSIMQRLHLQGRKVALGFGFAVVTVVAIGAFVAS